MPIQLRFTLTFRDFVDAQWLHGRTGGWLWKKLILAYFFGACLLLFCRSGHLER